MNPRFAIAALVALALAGCGGQTKPAADTPKADAPSTSVVVGTEAAPSTPAAAAKGEKPTREFVIGKWGTDGDCTLAIDLRPDGTSDGPFGNWQYVDGVISFPTEPDFKVNVTIIDDKTMESTNATNPKAAKMTRCP